MHPLIEILPHQLKGSVLLPFIILKCGALVFGLLGSGFSLCCRLV